MSDLKEEAAEIFLWRLHYGKLAASRDGRIPARESYGVTRRSQGLTEDDDSLLSPPRLIGLRRLEPELVDEEARRAGCLVVRCDGARTSFLRARFRPEDGENGHSRLYQQSAVWIADARDWRRHPAAMLAIASEDIIAAPDTVDEEEAARFGEAPQCYRAANLEPHSVRQALEQSCDETGWATPMLDFFADGAETRADVTLTFGARDFACERHFLMAAGLALQLVSRDYPRWTDISVVSGLRHNPPGLCLRYLPSISEAAAAQTSVAA